MLHHETAFIRLDAHRCEACWACVNACPKHVLGKVNLPIHKHMHVNHADLCIGCLKCMKACKYGAITKIKD